MLDHKSHLKSREVDVKPESINIAVSDSPRCTVVLVLPSAAELKHLRQAHQLTFSVRELSKTVPEEMRISYEDNLISLQNKYQRYKDSPTFLTHLSNLSSLTGRLPDAVSYLRSAVAVCNEPFLVHGLGAALIEQGEDDEALDVFANCDFEKDVHANLRIAYLLARKNRVVEAEKYVESALRIDNVDYAARMFEGAIHLRKGNWESAIRAFRVAAEENRNSSPLYVNLAAAYWGVGEEDKAIRTLRKACTIDPLNVNAVLFLADTMFLKGMPEACIGSLNTLLEYEQTNPAIWARIARAHYEYAKKTNDDKHVLGRALDALKKQAALKDDSQVWNNIGVVHNTMRDLHKARRYYAHAWVKAQELGEEVDLPLSNLLGALVELNEYRDVFRLSGEFLKSRAPGSQLTRAVCRIFVHHVVSMEALGERGKAAVEVERLLEEGTVDQEVKVELLTHLFYYRTVVEPDREVIEKYIPVALRDLETCRDLPKPLRFRMLNNVIFSLLQYDEVERAGKLIGKLGQWTHVDPWATATFGLFHAKCGNMERAESYYREAISLVPGKVTKARFRQRMYLELGKSHKKYENPREARRYLLKAVNERQGYHYVREDARRVMNVLQDEGTT